ncbi:MAG: hypothetical protein M3Q10_01850 [Chloroflexota bacterium]|nr:hypothetical protein [Chloroflexota bacterium]
MVDDNNSGSGTTTVPRIKLTLPDLSPPSPEEIERRRKLFNETMALREEIGPVGVRVEDLIHELRGGDDRFDK